MTTANRQRAAAVLRTAIHNHERALAALRAQLMRLERTPVLRLHRGRGIPGPTCTPCGDARMSWFARAGEFRCHRCGSVAPRQAG